MVNKRLIVDKVSGLRIKQDVYRLRHTHDAVLTGNGTLEADNPQYTIVVKNHTI